MSKAVAKSMAMQIVRSAGFIWLNRIVMSVVNCSRAEVVESKTILVWSRLEIFVDSVHNTTFSPGRRSEIARYEVPMDVSFPGFAIGVIKARHRT